MMRRFEFATPAILTMPRLPGADLDPTPAEGRVVALPRVGLAQRAPEARTVTPPLAASAIRQVLLQATPDHHPGQHLAVGVDVAARFGARLAAIYPMQRPPALPGLLRLAPPFLRLSGEVERAKADAAGERLRRLAERAGVGLDWHLADGEAGEVIGAAGRFHDLIVVPRSDASLGGFGTDVPRRATLRSGRPVLVVPPRSTSAEVGRRVLVFWNGSREAALAARAALPFLATADDVMVLATPDLLAGDVEVMPGFGLRTFLRRHGVSATVQSFEPEGASPAEALLDLAEASGCDLLVSGAYGTWPVHTWRLGGFTRALLGATRTPLLICR